jgi:hypothetical protein
MEASDQSMPLTITLRPEVEEWVQQEAAREGVTPAELAARALEAHWAVANRAPHLSSRESELLLKINEGFSEEFWRRFKELKARLDAEKLSEEERQEFIGLNAQLEGKNAERIAHLAQLARLRGMTLPKVMQQLGIGPIQVP